MQTSRLDISEAEAKQVTVLQLNRQGLEQIPVDLHRRFPNLEQLHLSHNKLKKIPRCLFRLAKLKILVLDGNALTKLPDAIASTIALRQLSLRDNRLRFLPALPAALETFDLANNRLREFPAHLRHNTRLTHLDLSGNALGTLPDELAEQWPHLRFLNCSASGLTQLPPLPARLYALIAARNQLSSLPPTIAQSPYLQRLDLSRNPGRFSLRQLPRALRYLDLRYTPTRWPGPEELLSHCPQLSHAYGGLPTRNQRILNDFLTEARRPADFSVLSYWQLWNGKQVPSLLPSQLLACLSGVQPLRVASTAHRQLGQRRLQLKPQAGQSVWGILGTTALPLAEILARMRGRGMKYAEDVGAANCVLLGYQLDELPQSVNTLTCISERDFLHQLDPQQGRYLTSKLNKGTDSSQLANDLHGENQAARELALQTLRAFGTPDALLPTLLEQWEKLRTAGYSDVLVPYLPPWWQRILLGGASRQKLPPLRTKLDRELY
ncbi:MAG: hypothetical protein D6772_11755, partial [Bacteroidetes bacterium]